MNTTWRYKLIAACFAIAAAFPASAQADSSMYFREAAAIDNLVPASKFIAFYPVTVQEDTSLAVRRDRFRELTVRQITPGENGVLFTYTYKWDKNGLLERYSELAGKDAQTLVYSAGFVYAGKSLIKTTSQGNGKNDTVWFSWTRGGKPGTTCLREGDSLVCDNRLYDGRGRIVVMENGKYGKQRGVYTYTYDDKGRLQTRSFNDSRWGYLICTDSLGYTFTDVNKTLLSTKHWLRVAGTITLIDEKITRPDGKVVRYLYHNSLPPNREIASPGGYVEYTYDTLGRRLTETYWHAETGPIILIDRHYGEMADSTFHYRYSGTKKKTKALSMLNVTAYTYVRKVNVTEEVPGDRMVASTQSFFYQRGRKGKMEVLSSTRYEYTWK